MWLVMMGIVCLAASIPFLFGSWVLVMLAKSLRPPADRSNRINRIRLFWFVLTRPELFADTFPWLKRDELDNVR